MENYKEYFMTEALIEAKKAYDLDEVPVGAVIVHDNKIIARAHNLRETSQEATSHAEIIAINRACKNLNTWRLTECELYVTLEPCIMCTGALILSRIKQVYFGASDPKFGSVVSVASILDIENYNHKVKYEGGILAEDCAQLLKDFFREIRLRKKD